MNAEHDDFCASAEWAAHLASEVIPWGLADLELGSCAVEFGGGFGASTAYLVEQFDELTVLEADPVLAAGLAERFPRANVLHADATAAPLPDSAADTVLCFTMLHHVPSPQAQDLLFAEAARIVGPRGWFAGTDSRASIELREFHAGDTYQPVDPDTLPGRLRGAGFTDVSVDLADGKFRFRART